MSQQAAAKMMNTDRITVFLTAMLTAIVSIIGELGEWRKVTSGDHVWSPDVTLQLSWVLLSLVDRHMDIYSLAFLVFVFVDCGCTLYGQEHMTRRVTNARA